MKENVDSAKAWSVFPESLGGRLQREGWRIHALTGRRLLIGAGAQNGKVRGTKSSAQDICVRK